MSSGIFLSFFIYLSLLLSCLGTSFSSRLFQWGSRHLFQQSSLVEALLSESISLTPKDFYWCPWTIPYSSAKRITVYERTRCLIEQVWVKEGDRNHVTTCGISFFPLSLCERVSSQTSKTYGLNMIIIN